MNGKTGDILKVLAGMGLSMTGIAILWYSTVNTSLATLALEVDGVKSQLGKIYSELREANLGGQFARLNALERRIELLEETRRSTLRRQQ